MKTVSAVLPVFNAGKTLLRAVNSLLNQPEINEILLVDDGSKDDSLKLCRELAEKHSIIELMTHKNNANLGAPASRNLGLSKVKNEWVQFMDADDELLKGKIAKQLAVISPGNCLVISPFKEVVGNREEVFYPLQDLWSGLIATRLGRTTSNLFNTLAVQKVGGWNEDLKNVQEYYLMFEVLKKNPSVSFSNEVLSLIYPQAGSITNSSDNMDFKRDNYFLFRNEIKSYLKEVHQYSLRRRHYFNLCTGENLRYHQPEFQIEWDSGYYSIYKTMKSLLSK